MFAEGTDESGLDCKISSAWIACLKAIVDISGVNKEMAWRIADGVRRNEDEKLSAAELCRQLWCVLVEAYKGQSSSVQQQPETSSIKPLSLHDSSLKVLNH